MPGAGGAHPGAGAGAGGVLQRIIINTNFGEGAIAVSCGTGMAIYTAVAAVDPLRSYTPPEPGLVVATLFVIVNLAIGVYVSSVGRRHRVLAFVNFCACFIALAIVKAHGGELDPELVMKIYDALV